MPRDSPGIIHKNDAPVVLVLINSVIRFNFSIYLTDRKAIRCVFRSFISKSYLIFIVNTIESMTALIMCAFVVFTLIPMKPVPTLAF